jgi:hypothetical protein
MALNRELIGILTGNTSDKTTVHCDFSPLLSGLEQQ